jgi:hypothetical protein
MRRQPLEHVLQIRVRVVPVDARRVDQAHDGGRSLARTQAAREQPIRSAQGNRADLVLDPIVRDRQVTVVKVARQRLPTLEGVVDRFGRGRAVRNLLALQQQPLVKQPGLPGVTCAVVFVVARRPAARRCRLRS